MLTLTRNHPAYCLKCNKQITSKEYANKLKLNKWLCFHDSRIKRLHDGVKEWINANYNNKLG